MVYCKIELKFKDYKDLSLIDSNEKFQIEIKEDEIIIQAKDYSSLRAGVNAVLKELILMEQLENIKL